MVTWQEFDRRLWNESACDLQPGNRSGSFVCVCVWQAGECVVSRDSGEAILAVDEKEELCRQTARRN